VIKAIVLVLFLLAGISLVVWADVSHRRASRPRVALITRAAGAACLIVFVFLAFYAFTFRVGAKQYGVLTTFGHPSGSDYSSGLHLKMPWQKDVPVDGKVKLYGFSADSSSGFDDTYGCIKTVIGNGSPTCVDVTVRWQVSENQASVLYANYGTGDPTDHFGQAVIHAQMLQVIPVVMRSYNPIAQLTVLKGKATGRSVETASFAPDYDALSRQAATLLQARVSGEATIQSVAISSAPLDPATQQKLSQFIQEQAKTRTALQAIETNRNVAKANKELERSLERSPGLLISKCLDELDDAINKGYALPAGFSCFGGNGSVVIPGATSK
jgi:regulator of protease activity HflC (stomatin/prohibitin superfamily)